jgi:hypothetical protein
MEPGAEFQKRGHAAVDLDLPFVRPGQPRDQAEQSALPRAVGPDHREAVAFMEFQRHLLERVEPLLVRGAKAVLDVGFDEPPRHLPGVDLRDAFQPDDTHGFTGNPQTGA